MELSRPGSTAARVRTAACFALGLAVLGGAAGAGAQSAPEAPTAAPAPKEPAAEASDDLLMPSLPGSSAPAAPSSPQPFSSVTAGVSVPVPAASATSLVSYMALRRAERKAAGETSAPLDVDIDPDAVRLARNFALAGAHMIVWPYLLSLLGGSGVSACKTCGPDHKEFATLAIPVVGPFVPLALGSRMSESAKGVLLADGLLQSVGLAMVIGSLAFSPRLHKKAPGPKSAGLTLDLTPAISPAGGGLGLSGSF